MRQIVYWGERLFKDGQLIGLIIASLFFAIFLNKLYGFCDTKLAEGAALLGGLLFAWPAVRLNMLGRERRQLVQMSLSLVEKQKNLTNSVNSEENLHSEIDKKLIEDASSEIKELEYRIKKSRNSLHDWTMTDEVLLYFGYISTLTGAWGAFLFL